jgi:hypothetical protein
MLSGGNNVCISGIPWNVTAGTSSTLTISPSTIDLIAREFNGNSNLNGAIVKIGTIGYSMTGSVINWSINVVNQPNARIENMKIYVREGSFYPQAQYFHQKFFAMNVQNCNSRPTCQSTLNTNDIPNFSCTKKYWIHIHTHAFYPPWRIATYASTPADPESMDNQFEVRPHISWFGAHEISFSGCRRSRRGEEEEPSAEDRETLHDEL